MNMSPDPSDGLANSFYYGESDPITFCMALSVYRLDEYAFAVVAQGFGLDAAWSGLAEAGQIVRQQCAAQDRLRAAFPPMPSISAPAF
jgi:hypothetical protein